MGEKGHTNPGLSANHERVSNGSVGRHSCFLCFFVFGPYQDFSTLCVPGRRCGRGDDCDGACNGGIGGNSFYGLEISLDSFLLNQEGIQGFPPKVVSEWNPLDAFITLGVKDR